MADANGANAANLLSKMQKVWGPGPLHKARLKGPAPDRLYLQPDYPRTPDLELGDAFLSGSVQYNGQKVKASAELDDFWKLLPSDGPLYGLAHGFSWLGALEEAAEQAADEVDAGAAARRYISGWLDEYEKWSPDVWSPRFVAERLTHWCCHGELILKGGDALWRSRVLTSMARQARHLAQVAHKARPGNDALMSALGLCLAGLCLPACEVAMERGQELLRRELRLQIRSDGGHISRSPTTQLEFVIRLQMVAKAYGERGLPVPGYMRLALSRGAAMVQFYRIGDGGLALFNGGYEEDRRAIIAASEALEEDTTPVGFARYTQYQRMSAARAVVIADIASGTEKGPGQKGKRFESPGSFHFSTGRIRMVTNCGSGDHLGGDWRKALRQGAAHSTLSFEGLPERTASLFSGQTIHQRAEEVSGILVEIIRPFAEQPAVPQAGAPVQDDAHEPIMDASPIADQTDSQMGPQTEELAGWHRRLYLSAGGDDLRGEDRIIALPEALRAHWRFRFHLHPEVKASLARDEQSVILVLPNQEGWRFRTNFRGVRLENSLYTGAGGAPVSTSQIVLGLPDGALSGLDRGDSHDIILKWAFRRLDGI